jgi:hypothetical protein
VKIEEILQLPVSDQISQLQQKKDIPDYNILRTQYDPEDHKVLQSLYRPGKSVRRSTGTTDSYGNEVYSTTTEEVNRIAAPFQRLIVERAVGFLLGNPVRLKSNADGQDQEDIIAMVQRTLDDNKSDYFNRKLARTVMSQCEAAELWYLVEDRTFWKRTLPDGNNIFKLRVKLLSPGNGDSLWPWFDEFGDMTAFSRGYTVTDSDGKVTEHFDTWTANMQYQRISVNGEWIVTAIPNLIGKIPVIYYSQPEAEWSQVQTAIERYETKVSNFADTNDYFGSPMVKVIGEVASLPDKTTSGKVIQLTAGSDASYMSWASAPESEKLEFDQLEKLIYAMTQTPNISFEQMKSMGGDMSGFAIKLMFTDAHLKAENKIELFGEMFQRRFNLIKHICGNVINVRLQGVVDILWIEPVFTPYLPKNVKEEIEILSAARASKPLISQLTAIENNPLVGNYDREVDRMAEDVEADAAAITRELTGTFNP